jgi:TMEM175 potassium channel family protein
MKSASKLPGDALSPSRLISFSDGVFAIAITILVFNLKVPEIPAAAVHRLLPEQVKAMWPHFMAYLLSFLLVAIYWAVHHRMLDLIIHVDNRFIWINIFYLLMVSFIPFPSALMGTYPDEAFTMVFYLCSMIAVGCFSMLLWWYASHNYRLITREVSALTIKFFFFRGFSTMTILLLDIPLAIYHVRLSQYCLFILFPVRILTRKYVRKHSRS